MYQILHEESELFESYVYLKSNRLALRKNLKLENKKRESIREGT